jgi:hypothetical protein
MFYDFITKGRLQPAFLLVAFLAAAPSFPPICAALQIDAADSSRRAWSNDQPAAIRIAHNRRR